MDLCFVFPALRRFGYESGFSIRNPAWGCGDPIEVEIARFRDGLRIDTTRVAVESSRMNVRLWESDWQPAGQGASKADSQADSQADSRAAPEPANPIDLLSLRVFYAGSDRQVPGLAKLEGQMLYRSRLGWSSSLLSNFVPLRAPGYKFSPIIHTAHYFADPAYASHTLLLNRGERSADDTSAGRMAVRVQGRDGSDLGQVERDLTANGVACFSLDDIVTSCGLDGRGTQGGYNLTFTGGASQFAIFTMFQHRGNGSIGMEHSLAPLYYVPRLRDPAVRARVYAWVGK